MSNIKDILNEYCEKNKLNKKYIISKLNMPVARLCDNQQELFNRNSNTKYNSHITKNDKKNPGTIAPGFFL